MTCLLWAALWVLPWETLAAVTWRTREGDKMCFLQQSEVEGFSSPFLASDLMDASYVNKEQTLHLVFLNAVPLFRHLDCASISNLNPRSFLWARGHAHISEKRKEKSIKGSKSPEDKDSVFFPSYCSTFLTPRSPLTNTDYIFMEVFVSGKELLVKAEDF